MPGNFRFICKYYVASIMKMIDQSPEIFAEEKWRQSASGSAHTDTETAFIRYPIVKSAFDVFESMAVDDRPLYKEPSVWHLIDDLAKRINRSPARAMVAKLNPKGKIAPHIDTGAYADATERYHIALSTNSSSYLICGDEKINIATGDCYWFNKHIMHSAVNDGDAPRLHMIIDFWRESSDVG